MSRQCSRRTLTSPQSSSLPRSRQTSITATVRSSLQAYQITHGPKISCFPADSVVDSVVASVKIDDHPDVPVSPMPQRLYSIRVPPIPKTRVVQFGNITSIIPADFKASAHEVKPFKPKPFGYNWTSGDDAHLYSLSPAIDVNTCEANGGPESGVDVPCHIVPTAMSGGSRAYFGFHSGFDRRVGVFDRHPLCIYSPVIPHAFVSSYGSDYQQTRLRSTLATRKSNEAAAAVTEATNVKTGHLKQGNTILKMASAGKLTKEKHDDQRASLRAGSDNSTPGGLKGADISAPESGRIIGGGPLGAMGGPKSGHTITTSATSPVKNSQGQLRGFTASSQELLGGSLKASPKGSETKELREKRLMNKNALEPISYEYTLSGSDNEVGNDAEAYSREHIHPGEEMTEELKKRRAANPLEYSPANEEMSKGAREGVEGSMKETGKETSQRRSGQGNKKGRKVDLKEKYRLEKKARKTGTGEVGL